MLIDVSKTKFFRLISVIALFLYIININASTQVNDDEEIIDLGVRLRGDNRDYLIADLIAEEREVLNAGHVSQIKTMTMKKKLLAISYF